VTRGPDHPQARATTVWPTAPLGPRGQTWPADGPPGSAVTAMAVSAEVAAYAIAIYSRTGDTVCDPDCRDGTVIVQAVRARRHAVGIAADLHAWRTARAALTVAKSGGAPGDGTILDRPPDAGSWTGFGPVDLLLTAMGPAADPTGADGTQADRLRTPRPARRRPGARLRRRGDLLLADRGPAHPHRDHDPPPRPRSPHPRPSRPDKRLPAAMDTGHGRPHPGQPRLHRRRRLGPYPGRPARPTRPVDHPPRRPPAHHRRTNLPPRPTPRTPRRRHLQRPASALGVPPRPVGGFRRRFQQ
jgi:modification methylase